MNIKIALLTLSLLVVGCSSGSQTSSTTNHVDTPLAAQSGDMTDELIVADQKIRYKVGIVASLKSDAYYAGDRWAGLRALFTEYDADISVVHVLDDFPEGDTCVVDDRTYEEQKADLDKEAVEYAEAGLPSAKLVELDENPSVHTYEGAQYDMKYSFFDYESTWGNYVNSEIPNIGNFTEGSFLRISGTTFPPLPDISLNPIEPLTGVIGWNGDSNVPLFRPVPPSTEIVWHKSESENSEMVIQFRHGEVAIECRTADDGSFTLPEDVRNRVEGELSITEFTRRTYSIEVRDDVLIRLTTISHSASI